jgi:hypothetical protein
MEERWNPRKVGSSAIKKLPRSRVFVMKCAKFFLLVFFSLFLLFPMSAAGDIIVLKNGEVFRGKVVERGEKEIILRVGYGRIFFETENIVDIIPESWDEENAPARRKKSEEAVEEVPVEEIEAEELPCPEPSVEKKEPLPDSESKGKSLKKNIVAFLENPFKGGFFKGLATVIPKRNSSRLFFYSFIFLAVFFFVLIGCKFSNFENLHIGKCVLLSLVTFILGSVNFVVGDAVQGAAASAGLLGGELLLWFMAILLIFNEGFYKSVLLLFSFLVSFSTFGAFVLLILLTILV